MGTQKETAIRVRRTFLGTVIGLIGAGVTGMLGAVIGRFAAAPAFAAADKAEWLELGDAAEIPDGRPVLRRVTVSQTSGWGRRESWRAVWVVRRGDRVRVFSGACPHLGCAIGAREGGFRCACHGSVWDGEGAKLDGPTPRDLDELEHRLDGATLQVRYRDFQQGLTTRQPLG